jgi:hypothetical protein
MEQVHPFSFAGSLDLLFPISQYLLEIAFCLL